MNNDSLAGRLTNVLCFTCGAQMRIRQAKKGRNAGNLFLGCSNFPNCRGTEEMPEDIADLFEEELDEEYIF